MGSMCAWLNGPPSSELLSGEDGGVSKIKGPLLGIKTKRRIVFI